jgi:flagellar biosynthesis/type III secretory pathway protein FliH
MSDKIVSNGFEKAAALQVLAKGQYEVWMRAQTAVEQAQADAEKAKRAVEAAIAVASAKAPEIEQAAFRKGFAEGQEKGVALWESEVKQCHERVTQLLAREREHIVAAAKEIAARCLREQLSDALLFEKHYGQVLREQPAEYGRCLKVFVAESQAAQVGESGLRIPALAGAKVIPDPNLRPGDLRLEYEDHWVDALIWTMVERAL